MKIIIPGGSGLVGGILSRAFHKDGHEVVVLSQTPRAAPWRTVPWDGETIGDWAAELDGADVVINLAGRSVNCRYTHENRRLIRDSRVNSVQAVGKAIQCAAAPPRMWLQASTATIYSHRYDAANDEATGVLGGAEPDAPDTWKFSIDVAKAWEMAIDAVETPKTRKVKMRMAMVMSPDRGGAFDTFLAITRFGLGGKAGDGQQFVSWIHDRDFVRAVYWLIGHEEMDGAVNTCSPNPLPNAEFMREIRKARGIRLALPSPAWLLEIATFFLRTESELVLKSRWVAPGRLLESGFTFEFPTWPEAARDLCTRWRSAQRNVIGNSLVEEDAL